MLPMYLCGCLSVSNFFYCLLLSWQPFADPNAKKKYTEVLYGAHIASTARSLVGSTLFGIALTVGLHLYKGMTMGLAIQTIMGPINLMDTPVVKALLIGSGFRPEDKIFEEKTATEMTPDDEIVDVAGNPLAKQLGGAPSGNTFEELMLDTWDAGNKADIGSFMEAITKENCNYTTKENGWTPLMILAGLNAKGTASAIRQVQELGGNPAIIDVEGWNALHWAAFHGSLDAAKELAKDASLLETKDKEGKMPIDMARAEKNDDIAKYLESLVTANDAAAVATNVEDSKSDGLRKRK
jgi:Phosphate transport (Pho88)/Ankyrin repeats (3 copies)